MSSLRSIYDFSLHNIHWFPSHMKRGIDDIKRIMSKCDLVIEVRDARLPMSTSNPILSHLIPPQKKRLIVLNKIDLIGGHASIFKKNSSQHKDFISNESFIPLSIRNTSSYRELFEKIKNSLYNTNEAPHHYRYSPLPGDSDITKENKRFKLLVVGLPNIGKSTIINRLRALGTERNTSAVSTGDRPGITRAVGGLVKIIEEPQVFIYDTPGILMPSLSESADPYLSHKLALIGCLHEAQYDERILVDYLFTILKERNEILHNGDTGSAAYQIKEDLQNSQEWITDYAEEKGLRKGDYSNSCKMILSTYRKGGFGKWVLDDKSTSGY